MPLPTSQAANLVPVRVEPAGLELEVAEGETVMAAAERSGYRWPTICKGMATCRTCVLKVLDGVDYLVPPGPTERSALAELPAAQQRPNVRLACQLEVRGPVVVEKRGVRPNRRLTDSEHGIGTPPANALGK